MRRLSPGLVLLRATAVVALVLLLWNPTSTRAIAPDVQPIVLLDASLSMTNAWRAALDSARAVAGRGGALVWRFGDRVAAFDSGAPAEGTSHLAPALDAAAARGGEVIVVTDGAVDDAAAMPPDLRRRPRVVLVPRPPFFDAFVASVDGPRRVTSTDTVRLRVSYGTAGVRDARGGMRDAGGGMRDARGGMRGATLTVSGDGRRLASRPVTLPDSGILTAELTYPASRISHPGWTALEVRLEGAADGESRDDARRFVVEVSPQPAAVLFASPPDWETRFLARALSDVARIPVKTFVETEPGRWRDALTLAPTTPADMQRAVQRARLVALAGDPERSRAFVPSPPSAALLVWATARGQAGDWYVERPSPSPLTAALAGVAWDSLPPAVAAGDTPRDSGVITVLTARLARRGSPRPVVTLEPGSRGEGGRRATVAAAGLWRWAFRGGAAAEGYRALVAGLTDWLLREPGAGSRERAVPLTIETPNGVPLAWRWTGVGEPRPLPIDLQGESGTRRDTLRFDAAGRAELRLPPGAYHYSLGTTFERGVVVVEEYSDEWRPAAPSITAQPGLPAGRVARVGLRDRWWLFAIAIAAFAAEWAWRRRQGLP